MVLFEELVTCIRRCNQMLGVVSNFRFVFIAKLSADHKSESKNMASSDNKPLPSETEFFFTPRQQDIVIDVRHPAEVAEMPLTCYPDNEVRCIPFFHLAEKSATLDPQASYLVYCEKGIMSRLHAAILRDRGFHNVGILGHSAR